MGPFGKLLGEAVGDDEEGKEVMMAFGDDVLGGDEGISDVWPIDGSSVPP